MGAPAGHRAARVACPPPGVGVTPAGSGPLAGLVLRKGNWVIFLIMHFAR